MPHLRHRLLRIASALLATPVAGTVAVVTVEGYPWSDVFYVTRVPITTAGYAEVHPVSTVGRVFNSCLILFGVIMLLLAVGTMSQAIIELVLNQFFGKRRIKNVIGKLEGLY